MKKLLIIALLAIASCAGEKAPNTGETVPTLESLSNLTIIGKVEKGPFEIYTNGTIQGQALDGTAIIGQGADVQTTDNSGSFASSIVFTDTLVKLAFVRFTGNYYNENTGAYVGPLELSSYVFDSASGKNNINLISHVVQRRVLALIQGGATPEDASIQATGEFTMQAANLSSSGKGSHEMGISDTSPLYPLSILLQHGVGGSSLQTLLNAIRTDFADGTLSQTYKDLIETNAAFINETLIASRVQTDLGITVQNISSILDTLDPSRLVTSKHVQGTGPQSYSSTAGPNMIVLVPFKITTAIQAKYIGLPCEVLGISIHNSDGVITGVYGVNLVQNLTISYGTLLESATYTPNALPLRDYGNGVITQHQATFATPLDLPVGVYWARMAVATGCPLTTYEPTAAEFVVTEEPLPDYFTYPVTSAGLNTLHLEFL